MTKQKQDYIIFIPSRARAKWLLTRRDDTLSQVAHLRPNLFIRTDDPEIDDYFLYANQHRAGIITFRPRDVFGYSQTCDLILDYAIEGGYKYLIILDDDLTLKSHNPIMNKKPDFCSIEPKYLTQLFSHARSILSPQVPLLSPVAILARTKPHLLNFCNWIVAANFLYVPHFQEHPEHRWFKGREIESRCDQNFTLQLLTSGFLTVGFAAMFYSTLMHNPGGCSIYRTIAVEEMAVEYLKDHYPEFVRLRHLKGWLGNKEVDRVAPIVAWKKALNQKAFRERFGVEPLVYCHQMILKYESVYSRFISHIRKESDEGHQT